MNIPKAIRSLKSNWFLRLSISTTPILCRIEVSHPVTQLFSQTVYHDFYLLTILFSVIFIIYHCYFFINSTQNTFYHLKISYVYFFYCLIIYYLTFFFFLFYTTHDKIHLQETYSFSIFCSNHIDKHLTMRYNHFRFKFVNFLSILRRISHGKKNRNNSTRNQ